MTDAELMYESLLEQAVAWFCIAAEVRPMPTGRGPEPDPFWQTSHWVGLAFDTRLALAN